MAKPVTQAIVIKIKVNNKKIVKGTLFLRKHIVKIKNNKYKINEPTGIANTNNKGPYVKNNDLKIMDKFIFPPLLN